MDRPIRSCVSRSRSKRFNAKRRVRGH